MAHYIEEFIESSQEATNVVELDALFGQAMDDRGYENHAMTSWQRQKPFEIHIDGLPEGFISHYVEQGWMYCDPVIDNVFCSHLPFLWSDPTIKDRLTVANERMMNDCRDLRVHSGITIPIYCPDRSITIISISRRASQKNQPDDIHYLLSLATQLWCRYCEIEGSPSRLIMQKSRNLTKRELEVMRWSREGKTTWEISVILNISEKTVQFHISNSINKLGVSNRTSAVVKAIQLGFIDL